MNTTPEFTMQLAIKSESPPTPKPPEEVKLPSYKRGRPPTTEEAALGTLWILDEKEGAPQAPIPVLASAPREVSPEYQRAVDLFCRSNLSFEEAQRLTAKPPLAIAVPQLLPTAQAIFGDIVDMVFISSAGEREQLIQSVERLKIKADRLDVDASAVVLKFTNGRHVSFSTSEWGQIEATAPFTEISAE